jgi:Tfp pilus assembly protein PilN
MDGQRKKSDSTTLEQVPPTNPIRSALHRRQRSRFPLATEAGRGTNLAAVFVAGLLSPASTASQEEQNNRRTPAKKEATREPFIHHKGLHHPRQNRPPPPWKLTGKLR